MDLKIIRPTSSQTMDVQWIEAQTEQGTLTILPNHAPMIILLAANSELSMELNDKTKTLITIVGGILEVTRNSVTLIITHE